MKGKRLTLFRIMCLLLACLMLQPAAGIWAASGLVELRSKSIELNDQLTLVTTTNYNTVNGKNAVEHYFEYTPGGNVKPLVCYGPGIYGVSSAKTIFRTEGEAGNPLAGLTNADFFVMATGVSLGPVIRDGIVRTGGYSESVIAFGEDGSVYFGDPSLNIALAFPGLNAKYEKVNYNKALTKANGICVFTTDFGTTNAATIPAYNVLLKIEHGSAKLGDTMECTVVSGAEAEGRTNLEEGTVLLSMAKDTSYEYTLGQLQGLQPGDPVTLSFSASSQYENVQHAVGFEKWLIKDGLICSGLDGSTRAPRTAAGLKADGTFILYTMDGRQSDYSMGVTVGGLAQHMEELGCVQAVNLDGGASTQLFAVLPGDTAEQQINVDSEANGLRSCANYIAFANYNQPGGIPAHLHIYPYDEYLLSGASLELTAKATDAGYFAAAVPENITYSCDDLGTLDGNVYTAGSKAGIGTISARSGKATGSVRVNIVANPDSITAYVDGKAKTTLSAGLDKSYQLSASAFYKGETLRSDAACYTWTVTGDIGTIDENGVFTAKGEHGNTGTILCSAGNKTKTISVTLQQTLPTEDLQSWIREIVEDVNE